MFSVESGRLELDITLKVLNQCSRLFVTGYCYKHATAHCGICCWNL